MQQVLNAPPAGPELTPPYRVAQPRRAQADELIWLSDAPAWPHRAAPRKPRRRLAVALTGAGVVVAFALLAGGAAAVGGGLFAAIDVSNDPGRYLGAALAGGAAATAGLMLLLLCARPLGRVATAAAAVAALTSGVVLLTIAPVVRQSASDAVAHDRGFRVLLLGGAALAAAGVLLGALALDWAMRPGARAAISRALRVGAAAYGVMLGISGLVAVPAVMVAAVRMEGRGDAIETALSGTAIAMWSLVPGLMLTWHGITASMGEPSSAFRAPRAPWALLPFAAVILIGGLAMAAAEPAAAPMPPLHALAAALPGLALVAMAARGAPLGGVAVRGLTWRQVMVAMAASMTLATTLALYVEGLAGWSGTVLLLVHHGAFRDVVDIAGFNDAYRAADDILSRNEQFVLNLIVGVAAAPVIEEAGKGLGVRAMLRRNTTRQQAFVLGACAGAAFGFLEAMLYGVAAVGQGGPGVWWQIMLVRGGSTSLHVMNSAIVGVAWSYATLGRRPGRAWALYGLAVLSHATWNGFATVLQSRILGLETLSDRTLEAIAYAFVGVIALGFVMLVPYVARRLREPPVPPVEGTPIASMSPWLS